MIRRMMATVLVVLVMGSGASAQAAPGAPLPNAGAGKLIWRTGQVLLYQIEHTTLAFDKREESKSETKSYLKVTKRWQAIGVDSAGVATLQMSLTSMLQELTTPGGEVLRFDSANVDKSTPQLKGMADYLNKPLAVIRVDSVGRVVEVKSSKSAASNYENELPFLALMPGAMPKVGQSWNREFKITLAPPLGTGEKYDSIQKHTCKSVAGDLLTVSVSTDLKTLPKAVADVVPMWQMLPRGEVVFDLKAGRLHSAKLTIDKELKDHQGEGSQTKFQSVLTVSYIGDK
jgi:hypothetical protein